MKLNLKRPIIFFDLETTGVDTAKDRIVEISMAKIMPDGEEIVKTPQAQSGNAHSGGGYRHPRHYGRGRQGLPDLRAGRQVARTVHPRLRLRRVQFEPLRPAGAGRGVPARGSGRGLQAPQIHRRAEHLPQEGAAHAGGGLQVLLRQGSRTDAHSAEADTLATYEVLKAQLDRYPESGERHRQVWPNSRPAPKRPTTPDASSSTKKARRSSDSANTRAVSVEEVFRMEPSYYAWMMNGDFPLYTKKVITEIRMREKLK